MATKEAEDFRSSLCDLTVNSKPLISMLTMLAEENIEHAEQIVQVIEKHIFQAKATEKLPSLYLIDSILKNLRTTNYVKFFQQNIVKVFCHVFEKVEERTRQSMFKLRQTWVDILSSRKLYALDVRVNQIDPAWPVSSAPPAAAKEPTSPSSIHVNPRFLQNQPSTPSSGAANVADFAQKKEELLAIQQKQLELELAKARVQMEKQKQELAQLQAQLGQPAAAQGPSDPRTKPVDPRLARKKQPSTAEPPTEPLQVSSHHANIPQPPPPQERLSIPLPAEEPNRPTKPVVTAPPSSSFGALLNQAAADVALSQLDENKDKLPVISKKLPKFKQLDGEDVNERGFKNRRPFQDRAKPLNNRDQQQWNNRRGNGSNRRTKGPLIDRGVERALPYDRPGDESKTREGANSNLIDRGVERVLPYDRPGSSSSSNSSSARRRNRRDRSRSRSRSKSPRKSRSSSRSLSRSRSRSRSPGRDTSNKRFTKGKDRKKKETKDSIATSGPNKEGSAKSTPTQSTTSSDAINDTISSVISMSTTPASDDVKILQDSSDRGIDDKHKTKPKDAKINISLEKDKVKDSKETKKGKDSKQEEKLSKGDKSSAGQEDNLDVDLRKKRRTSPAPKGSKKRSDSKSPDRSATDRKKSRRSPAPRTRSPPRGRSPPKRRKDGESNVAQDEDLRKRDIPSVADKDEDLRSNRDRLMKEQWESSKAKHLPRIPKRKKAKGQYRERDDFSPSHDTHPTSESGPLSGFANPDEVDKTSANKGDVDLRSLPVVRPPSHSDTDNSSDTDAEDLANLNKRRKQRNRIVEDEKSGRDGKRSRGHSRSKDVDLRKKRTPDRREVQAETFNEDEDFRIRPPPPGKARPSKVGGHNEDTNLRSRPSQQQAGSDRNAANRSMGDKDEDLRIPPSPGGSHSGWNKFKQANPRDFYTPNKVQRRHSENVQPLHMNDKGLDLLGQKELILSQAQVQFSKGEINEEQYDEVKYRFQELELIRRAQHVKAFSNFNQQQRQQQRMVNPYDQRGGGPMIIQRQQYQHPSVGMLQRPPGPIAGFIDPKLVALLTAIRNNSNNPQVKSVLENLQPGNQTAIRRGSRDSALGVPTQRDLGGAGRASAPLLPTPGAIGLKPHINPALSRMNSLDPAGSKSRELPYEVVIDGNPYELLMGNKPRRIRIADRDCVIEADKENREIRIDGSCHYKVGEPVRDWYMAGAKHTIFYQGPAVNFWLNDSQMDVRIDAPPLEFTLDNQKHIIQVEGHTNNLLIDQKSAGRFGGPPREVVIGSRRHWIAFEAPPREILIDGKLCRLKSDGPSPVVIIDNKVHGIRFDGPPREVNIDEVSYMVPVDSPIRVKIGKRAHILTIGGPGKELIIDNKSYEIMFNGPPRTIQIGGNMRQVRLVGNPPEVRILGEVIPDDVPHGPNPAPHINPMFMRNRPHLTNAMGKFPPQRPSLQPPPGVKDMAPLAPPPQPPTKALLPTPTNAPAASDDRPPPLLQPPRPPFMDINHRHRQNFNQPPVHTRLPGPDIGGSRPRGPLQDMQPSFGSSLDPRGAPHERGEHRGPNTDPRGAPHNREEQPRPNTDPRGAPHTQGEQPGSSTDTRGHSMDVDYRGFQRGRPGDPYGPRRGQRPDLAPADPRLRQRSEFTPPTDPRQMSRPIRPNFNRPPPGFFQLTQPVAPNVGHGMPDQPSDHSGKAESDTNNRAADVPAEAPAAVQLPSLDINSLFSKLLAHGIISKKEEVDKMTKVPNLTSLSSRLLSQKYEGVIERLYTGNQCARCGLRFLKSAETKYNDHLDWHFRQSTRESTRTIHGTSRGWYIQVEDWISYEEFSDVTESNIFLNSQQQAASGTIASGGGDDIHPDAIACPKASGRDVDDSCCVCHEPFERYWDDDEEEWHLKDAVRIVDKTYHPVCYEDAVETSIMEGSMSVEEMSSALSASTSVPQSPRSSIPPQSPRTPLMSPSTINPPLLSAPPAINDTEKESKDSAVSNSSGGSGREPTSKPEILTPKTEPLNPFDLLSGLINKTKQSAETQGRSSRPSDDDPLQMLAGLMKTVKPPTSEEVNAAVSSTSASGEVKVEPIVSSTNILAPPAVTTSSQRSSAVSVKKEAPEATRRITTIGGVPLPANSNVTILPQPPTSQTFSHGPEGPHQFQRLPHHSPLRHHMQQPPIRPGQPPLRLRHSVPPHGSEFGGHQPSPYAVPGQPMLRHPGQLGHQGPPMHQRPPLSQGQPHLSQHTPPRLANSQLPAQSHSAVTGPMHHGPPLHTHLMHQGSHQQRPPMHQGPPRQAPPMQQGPPQFRGAPPMLQGAGFPSGSLPPGHLPNVNRPPMMMSNTTPTLTSRPPAMMAHAGAPPLMMMTTGPAPMMHQQTDEDEGTPVRDEREDGVERCATPVMDEPAGDDGGSTPVRDEWD